MKSYGVYQFNVLSILSCNYSYIGKTERNLCTRTEEHACSDEVPFTNTLTTVFMTTILKI